ncbi:MAG: RES family NAD+ phosphorylase [Pseudorhodoplanes sp.]
MAPPSPGPLPPADFASREPPLETIPDGARLTRIHRSDLGPLFFGSTGGNRFDDPAQSYGVCYLSTTLEGAFAETCLRSVGARFVALTFLEARSFSEIEVTAPLHLVSLHGPGLAQIGATGAVTSGPHVVAQQWSRAIHDHPAAPDGIAYRSNHDNGEICVALFERAGDRLAPGNSQPMTIDSVRLAELLARYKVGLG